MKSLTEKQRKQRQEFVTHTVDQQFKIEEHITEWEQLLTRLGLTELNCTESAEVREWVTSRRNSRYIPEPILRRLGIRTMFDEGNLAPYSLTESGVVIEPAPLEELEEEVGNDAETTQEAA